MKRLQKSISRYQHLNQLPVAIRRKTTPELHERFQVLNQIPAVQEALQKPKLDYKEANNLVMGWNEFFAIGPHQYYSTLDGNKLFDQPSMIRNAIKMSQRNVFPYLGELITAWHDNEWKTIDDIYSSLKNKTMYIKKKGAPAKLGARIHYSDWEKLNTEDRGHYEEVSEEQAAEEKQAKKDEKQQQKEDNKENLSSQTDINSAEDKKNADKNRDPESLDNTVSNGPSQGVQGTGNETGNASGAGLNLNQAGTSDLSDQAQRV